MAEMSTSVARREDDPLTTSRPKIAFVSSCPKCGRGRQQHGYTHRILFKLLNRRSNIDAYCVNCNVCWPISESERRAISWQLNLRPQAHSSARSAWCSQRRESRDPTWRDNRDPPVSQLSLQRALRTLRAIRLRYEIDRRNSQARTRRVLVALSRADMQWVNAAIETLEKAIAADVTATAVSPVQAHWSRAP
jgi:hypothetical protein